MFTTESGFVLEIMEKVFLRKSRKNWKNILQMILMKEIQQEALA
jgi:hypothetical protein